MFNSRIARVSEMIKAELGFVIDQELANPRIPPFVTVHSVKVTNDLRSAQVFITFLQDESEETIKEAVHELNTAAKFIRARLAQRVTLRYLPSLKFHYNPSTHYAADLQKILTGIDLPPLDEEDEDGHPEPEPSNKQSRSRGGE